MVAKGMLTAMVESRSQGADRNRRPGYQTGSTAGRRCGGKLGGDAVGQSAYHHAAKGRAIDREQLGSERRGLAGRADPRSVIAAQQAGQLALHHDPLWLIHLSLIGRVGGIEANGAALPMKIFQRCVLAIDQGDDNVAFASGL